MKILLVITGLGVGGAERLVTALADYYVSQGHDVMLVLFHGDTELCPVDSRVRVVNLNMKRNPFGVIGALSRLRRLIGEFQPEVVNSHLVHANILTRLLRLVTPMPDFQCSQYQRGRSVEDVGLPADRPAGGHIYQCIRRSRSSLPGSGGPLSGANACHSQWY